MIDGSLNVFPMNVCSLMATRLQTIDADLRVLQRPVRDSDGTQVIGVFPITWTPDDTSFEMNGSSPSIPKTEPTLQRYVIGIQSFVKHTNEQSGIKIHATLSKMVRALLYRDAPLYVGLNALSVVMYGSTERIQRRGLQTQRYLANEIDGVFLFLSTAEYFVETETV